MNMKKRTVIVIGIVVLVLATAGLVAATMIPSAEELLIASLERLESVSSGHAVVDLELQMPEQDVSATVEIWGELNIGPNGEPAARLLILESSEMEYVGLTIVTDGSDFWLYSPVRNSVIVGQADELATLIAEKMAEHEGQWDQGGDFTIDPADHPETPAEAVELILEYATVQRNGSSLIGDQETDLLRIVPIADKMPEEIRLAGGFINLWLRASDQLPVAAEYAESAFGHAKFEASQIQVGESIDPNIFSFEIPEGVEVIQATELLTRLESLNEMADPADLDIMSLGQLPAGSEPAGTEQFGSTVVQRFALSGGRSFVIAQGASIPLDAPVEATSSQTVTVRGSAGMLHSNEDASRTMLVWQEDSLFIMVAGDLSPEQALAVAESLQ